MIQFHETGYGKRFFESQLPRLITALEKIADNLEEENQRKTREEIKNNKEQE